MIHQTMIHQTTIQPDREEEQPDPVIPLAGTSYAKDCIPLENNCNVTVVTDGRTGTPAERYSYLNASAGKIRAADHDG
jgi:hypothetical protein